MARKQTGDFSALIRDAGSRAKLIAEQRLEISNRIPQDQQDPTQELVVDDILPFKPRIFNILEYIEQGWGLGMNLYPAQRFIVKLYYSLPLETHEKKIKISDMFGEKTLYHFTEKEYLTYLYNEGRCNIGEQDHERRELVLALGRRAGKTALSSIFASYEIYRLLNLHNPQQYYGLPNGNRIQIISVATDKDQAGLLFNEVTTHLAKCEYFRPHIANNTQSHIQFRTPYDIERYGPTARMQNGKFVSFNGKATLRVTFKSCIAKGLRGAGNIVVIMDEMAHFVDTGQSSAKDIYDAISPSSATYSPKGADGMPLLKSDGKQYPVESRLISISSPLNKSGKFYELYALGMSRNPGSENMLVLQASTWEINPTVASSYYRQKYFADPSVFMTEHGAQFSDRVRGWIEREVDLEACLDQDQRPLLIGIPKYPYQMGVDIGLMGDGTAIAVTTSMDNKIILVYHEYWQAGVPWRDSNPHLGENFSTDYCKALDRVERLDFDEISNWIFGLTKKFHITEGLFDRWNGIPLEQTLLKKGLTQFKAEYFQRDLSSKIYQNTKMAMFDRGLRLYDYPLARGSRHSTLINELLQLQSQQMSRNIVVVSAPQTAGHHDDCSDALVRAIWLTSENARNEKHVYGATVNPSRAFLGGMTAARYQVMRARGHGGFTERMVPRNIGLRLRPR